jgi:predicted lipoprotein with Yx(FWY)xxD motif
MRTFTKTSLLGIAAVAAAVLLAGCGSSYGNKPAAASKPSTTTSSSSTDPATKFSIASVAGVGNAVVDGNGRTVYVLTSASTKNVPCTDGNGCTKIWPDLALPDGVSSAKAGSGLKASLLGTKMTNGETYATYNGWLLYEYSGDSNPGDGNGQGIQSFGGTWYVLDASGNPVKSGGGGYGSNGGY